ncbi:hypothetical protein [Chlorogloea sp. CCALA 695]|uniref:hypothetical protein n=1 Tax=Chlorogloea sp. CCALA 695 TaxID=2107693 RepID=UPI000D075731|nr:hypothetical protein [Chlorogloea sp. CCALA 695]PSB28692.1 hypothetical protein C7B70_20480 [Chlorogloea sp. CCALA 695]
MKTKYTKEIVEIILSVFRETGSDKAAYLCANVSADTFYKWKLKYPEFSEALALAAAEFRRFAPESFIQQAKESLRDYLFDGAVETWSSKEVHKDADGNIIKTVERVSKVVRPTPPWVIDRVLGKNIPLLEAMQVLLTEGVATSDQARIISTGISRIEDELKRLPASNGTSTK